MINVRPLTPDRAEQLLLELLPHQLDRLADQVAAFSVLLRRHRRCCSRVELSRLAEALAGHAHTLDAMAKACPSLRPAAGEE